MWSNSLPICHRLNLRKIHFFLNWFFAHMNENILSMFIPIAIITHLDDYIWPCMHIYICMDTNLTSKSSNLFRWWITKTPSYMFNWRKLPRTLSGIFLNINIIQMVGMELLNFVNKMICHHLKLNLTPIGNSLFSFFPFLFFFPVILLLFNLLCSILLHSYLFWYTASLKFHFSKILTP